MRHCRVPPVTIHLLSVLNKDVLTIEIEEIGGEEKREEIDIRIDNDTIGNSLRVRNILVWRKVSHNFKGLTSLTMCEYFGFFVVSGPFFEQKDRMSINPSLLLPQNLRNFNCCRIRKPIRFRGG